MLSCCDFKIDCYICKMFEVILRVTTKQKPRVDTKKREESRCSFSKNHWSTKKVREEGTKEPQNSQKTIRFSCSVVSNSLQLHKVQHARLPCPSPTSGVCSNPCPWSWWCHPTISSSVVPFSSCFQAFPASKSFPMSQLFALGGQNIGVSVSASVLPMNIQDLFPLGLDHSLALLNETMSHAV